MARTLDHVILTRFNLPSASIEGAIRAQDGWLTERVGLFERYCLPSVRAQSESRFRWIIYFDPESPAWLKDWIGQERHRSAFRPIFRASVDRSELLGDIRGVIDPGTAELITTNLDNDDALAADFIRRIQGADRPAGRSALYLGFGLIKSGPDLYLRRDPSNAFCSVREPAETAVTCWADWHTHLGRSMSVVALDGEPGWLQVIHGKNVSNRIQGRRVAPAPYHGLFPGLLDDVEAPALPAVAYDALVCRPKRFVREVGRRAAKNTALALLGRSGPDRVKRAWLTVAGRHPG